MMVTFEIAQLAAANDYTEHCDWRYDLHNDNKLINWKDELVSRLFNDVENVSGYAEHYVNNLKSFYNQEFDNDDKDYYLAAPSYQQITDWFREVKGLNISLYPADSGDYVYYISTTDSSNQRLCQDGNWDYYKAWTKGILKAFEILQTPYYAEYKNK